MEQDPGRRRLVADARVARLGTHDLDGRLHLVPICFALIGDAIYSAVDSKPKRSQALRRLANIAGDPDVCVLVDEYDEDWTALWWVRLRGRARVLESGDDRERVLTALRAKYPQYATDPLDGPVLAIAIDEWRSWEASARVYDRAPMARADVEALIDRYNRAWNEQELDEIAALHAPDVVFHNHTAGERIEGARDVRAHIAGIFERWPDLRFRGRRLYVADDFAVSEWTATATHPDGRLLEWDGVDVFPLRDGLIARKDVYSSSHAPRTIPGDH